jgi:hypothetical protein
MLTNQFTRLAFHQQGPIGPVQMAAIALKVFFFIFPLP